MKMFYCWPTSSFPKYDFWSLKSIQHFAELPYSFSISLMLKMEMRIYGKKICDSDFPKEPNQPKVQNYKMSSLSSSNLERANKEKEKGNEAFKKANWGEWRAIGLRATFEGLTAVSLLSLLHSLAEAVGFYSAAILADPTNSTFPLNRAMAWIKLKRSIKPSSWWYTIRHYFSADLLPFLPLSGLSMRNRIVTQLWTW